MIELDNIFKDVQDRFNKDGFIKPEFYAIWNNGTIKPILFEEGSTKDAVADLVRKFCYDNKPDAVAQIICASVFYPPSWADVDQLDADKEYYKKVKSASQSKELVTVRVERYDGDEVFGWEVLKNPIRLGPLINFGKNKTAGLFADLLPPK